MKRVYQISVLVSVLALSMVSCTYDFLPPLGEDCDEDFDSLVPLEGDVELLVGSWEWFESKGPCGTKYPDFCYSTPQSEGFTETLELLQEGRFIRYRNGDTIETGKIEILVHDTGLFYGWSFWLYMQTCPKEPDYYWTNSYFLTKDTLVFSHYPFEYSGVNGFVRK